MNPEDTQATPQEIKEIQSMIMLSKGNKSVVAISQSLHEALKRQCKAEGKKISWVVSKLIIEYLKKAKEGV